MDNENDVGANILFQELRKADVHEPKIREIIDSNNKILHYLTASDGSTALHIAAYNLKHVSSSLLKYIIDQYPDAAKIPNKFGLLPMHKGLLLITYAYNQSFSKSYFPKILQL